MRSFCVCTFTAVDVNDRDAAPAQHIGVSFCQLADERICQLTSKRNHVDHQRRLAMLLT